jgi:phosphoglycolate phosphatase
VTDALRAVLFDLDGTLVDTEPGVVTSILHAIDSLGLPHPDVDVLRSMLGPPLHDSFASVFGLAGEKRDAAIKSYRDYYSTTGLYDCTAYDGVPAMLQELTAAGYELLVTTSKAEPFAERVLEHVGLAGRFRAVHGATLDGAVRTKGQIVTRALAATGLAGAECVLIGDREFDVTGAAGCGVATIGVSWGYGTAEELQGAGAVEVVDTPAGLAAAVGRFAAR